MSSLPASFYRAEAAYLQPPESPDSRVQIEGCLEFSSLLDMECISTGDLDDISIIDGGFDPETSTLKVWISGWLDCDREGEWDRDKIGDLLSTEVVDTEGVDFGPDPDEEWDNREF